jgi:hypothetical protein
MQLFPEPGEILARAPLIIVNSIFTFKNGTELFNNGGTLSITASTFIFNDNSFLLANACLVNLQTLNISGQVFQER